MQRALVWLNLYGREAVLHKLKKGQKCIFCVFLAIFELMSDSLTDIWIEPYQCPSHQSILLTQGPIHEIFTNNIENWRFWKMTFFWVGHFEFNFYKKKFFFCFILMKISHKLCVRMDGTQFLWLWWYTAKTQSPQTFQPAVYFTMYLLSTYLNCGFQKRLL